MPYRLDLKGFMLLIKDECLLYDGVYMGREAEKERQFSVP